MRSLVAICSAVLWLGAGSGCARKCGPADLTEVTMAAAEAQGSALRSALAGYRERHGIYPDSLAELRLEAAALALPCGVIWSYSPSTGRVSYSLRAGDYSENGFVLWWDEARADWQWDT